MIKLSTKNMINKIFNKNIIISIMIIIHFKM